MINHEKPHSSNSPRESLAQDLMSVRIHVERACALRRALCRAEVRDVTRIAEVGEEIDRLHLRERALVAQLRIERLS